MLPDLFTFNIRRSKSNISLFDQFISCIAATGFYAGKNIWCIGVFLLNKVVFYAR